MTIDPELALTMVRDDKVIAFDTETDGLSATAKSVGYVFTDVSGANSVYVPVRHGGGGNIPEPEAFEKALADAFNVRARNSLLTIGHNLSFDLDIAARHGILIRGRLEDTMINEGLIDDNAAGYGLDACSRRHGVTVKLGAELYAEIARRFGGMPDRNSMSNFWRMPGDHPLVVDYATGDGISTIELWKSQSAVIAEEHLEKVHRLECDLIPYVAAIRRRGLKVDANAGERVLAGIDKKLEEAKARFPSGFNVRSSKDVKDLMLRIGRLDYPTTAKGAPSFREKWLETFDEGQAILTVRQLDKAKDSFIAPLLETHNVNGRVHPSLNQSKSDEYGTVTGRFSCSDPNLQAYPKRNRAIGELVRQLVVPDFGELYEPDFIQQEPRLFGHYSQDTALLAGYRQNPPLDIHDTAAKLTGRPRKDAKRLGLGILTGMGYKALAGHMGWTISEATAAHKEFLEEAFPGIRDFQLAATSAARRRGWIHTILGRRARFPDVRFAYRAVSRIIQGTGADHLKMALLLACQYAESVDNLDVLMTIHDSVLFQTDDLAKAKEIVRIMESVPHLPDFDLALPIPMECAKGSNWSEASYNDNIKTVNGWTV